MRIGIDIRCFAEGRHTGVEEYTRELLQELFRQDQENEYVLFFNSWSAPRADFSWIDAFPHVTLRVFRYPNKLLNLSLWYLRRPYIDRLLGWRRSPLCSESELRRCLAAGQIGSHCP
ncbi:MAG: hypothetical protein WDN67_04165 [Candidatus Moraniibacteriota bacterium]